MFSAACGNGVKSSPADTISKIVIKYSRGAFGIFLIKPFLKELFRDVSCEREHVNDFFFFTQLPRSRRYVKGRFRFWSFWSHLRWLALWLSRLLIVISAVFYRISLDSNFIFVPRNVLLNGFELIGLVLPYAREFPCGLAELSAVERLGEW